MDAIVSVVVIVTTVGWYPTSNDVTYFGIVMVVLVGPPIPPTGLFGSTRMHSVGPMTWFPE